MMLEAIPPQVLTGIGWGGLILLAVWLIFTDRLIPRASHLREMSQKDDHIAYLRKTVDVRDEQVRIRDEQIQKLLTNSDLTVQLLQSLQSVVREARRGDVA
jgi:uncharacterized protein (DUF3084 family)